METAPRPKTDSVRRSASELPPDPNDFAAAVGESIRRARQEQGRTQAQLAEGAGLSVNYISRLERGELGPSLFVASRIADALRLPLEALIKGTSIRGTSIRRTTRRRVA